MAVMIDLGKVSKTFTASLHLGAVVLLLAGFWVHPAFLVFAGILLIFCVNDLYLRYVQKSHAVLRNFGMFGSLRYILESIGPELRQYWIASDTEERPFSRRERDEVYLMAKNSKVRSAAFGTLEDLSDGTLRHSLYPLSKKDLVPFSLTFGEERNCKNSFTIQKPFMISAMSHGALGDHAVRALSRGARKAGIPICTGEGGFPKYHLMEEPNIVFQMGTAKFGVRNPDSSLNEDKLRELAKLPNIKMIEIKLSQGAKPGKGGLLPAEKVTPEISELRGVPLGKDVFSPPRHFECNNAEDTVRFVQRVQEVSQLPVGIKFCLGNELEFIDLVKEMKSQNGFPDYLAVDGAEGGTGAAPRSFMDYVGVSLFDALDFIQAVLEKERVRDKLKIVASGKLINSGRMLKAFAFGADAVYTARGFMFSLGCIQALRCNTGNCPVGITTHDPRLQRGLDIEEKSGRVENYANNLFSDMQDLLAATGRKSFKELDKSLLSQLKEGNSNSPGPSKSIWSKVEI